MATLARFVLLALSMILLPQSSCDGCDAEEPSFNGNDGTFGLGGYSYDPGPDEAIVIGGTNNMAGVQLSAVFTLDEITASPGDGDCRIYNSECVQERSCIFRVTLKFAATVTGGVGNFPAINVEAPFPTSQGQQYPYTTWMYADGATANDNGTSSASYSFEMFIEPGCGSYQELLIAPDTIHFSSGAWQFNGLGNDAATVVIMSCTQCR